MLAAFCLYPRLAGADSGEAAAGVAALIMGIFFTGFFSLWFLFVSLMVCVNIGGMILWIIMLIDCVKREFSNENDKLIWTLVIVFAGWIGALIYYFVVKKEEDK